MDWSEPDGGLLIRLRESLAANPLPVPSRFLQGTVADLVLTDQFDTILYIDVLEHIEDDRGELGLCAPHVRPGGHIVLLAPAHDWLFSPFDRAIGHFRRYSTSRLAHITPEGLELRSAFYLDSVGMLASLANRALLKEASPTLRQIRFWDSTLVRLSRVLDPVTGRRIGKSVVGVWGKPATLRE